MNARSYVNRRSYVKMDRFAMFRMRRDCLLKPTEWMILVSLALLAHWETHEWSGTIRGFAQDDLGMSPKTVTAVFKKFESQQLIKIVRPFGRNTEGVVKVLCYGALVVPERPRSDRPTAVDARPSRVDVASRSRPGRVEVASNDATRPRDYKRNKDARGSEAARGEGSGTAGLLESLRKHSPMGVELLRNFPEAEGPIRELFENLGIEDDVDVASEADLGKLKAGLFDLEGKFDD